MIIFTVLSRKHDKTIPDFSRKKRHAFILYGFTVERQNIEVDKILCFDQLR
jgi:hypothetical protein